MRIPAYIYHVNTISDDAASAYPTKTYAGICSVEITNVDGEQFLLAGVDISRTYQVVAYTLTNLYDGDELYLLTTGKRLEVRSVSLVRDGVYKLVAVEMK